MKNWPTFTSAVPSKKAASHQTATFGRDGVRALTVVSWVPDLLRSQVSELKQLSHFGDPEQKKQCPVTRPLTSSAVPIWMCCQKWFASGAALGKNPVFVSTTVLDQGCRVSFHHSGKLRAQALECGTLFLIKEKSLHFYSASVSDLTWLSPGGVHLALMLRKTNKLVQMFF